MTERTVITSTFEIERAYPVAKARWFTGAGVDKYELDFRPAWREQGTNDWLTALGEELRR
ncbi:hypothetical protein ACTG9Q_23090 [Actinokineospora sp. 24-640]